MDYSSSIVLTTITSSALFVLIIQWLKKSSWFPLLQSGRKWTSRIASGVLATAGSIGASYIWNPGTRQLILTLPTVWQTAVALWHIANHFAVQEVIYQSTVNKLSVTTTPQGATMTPKVTSEGAVVIPKGGSNA